MAVFAGSQLILTPQNVWVPLSVVMMFLSGFFGISVWATIRVVRIVDRITRNQSVLFKHLGLDEEDHK